MRDMNWKEVGSINVDAGLCWVGDPCYVMGNDASHHPAETWRKFCDELSARKKKGVAEWGEGIGVTVETGYGDGTYPVEVKRNEEGRIMAMRVVFIDDYDSDSY